MIQPYEVPYTEFKALCLSMSEQAQLFRPDAVLCIARGGMTASHIIAKALNLPIAFIIRYGHMTQSAGLDLFQRLLVVDDMVDQGRTFDLVKYYLDKFFPNKEVMYSAVFQVGDYEVDLVGEVAKDKWLIMPNEESCKVTVGDKNLFSEGSSKYGTS
jgi:hypoxanthine phosphoribosyltransferase